jgi:ATP-dependent DNA helicase RecQ
MPDSAIVETARESFGWDALREGQREAVDALIDGRDVIAVLSTGAGKSAVYQLAGTIRDGVTVVVSPLIALQNDQLAQLADAPDAPGGLALNSTLGERATADAWQRLRDGTARFVFLTPEQLAKDAVTAELRKIGVALLAVDEAHCVASWGHDFRPDYLRLGAARERLGRPPVAALTATGAEPVREEIAERLGMRDPLLVVRGVDRPNIDLTVHRATSPEEKRRSVLALVPTLPRPGLVYTATRREAEEYAEALGDEGGMRARVYHAGIPAAQRAETHRAFLDDDVDVVVATNAFGMGIDKPNVRFVVHASVPESLDAYYQEIGRAGRDGEPAEAVLFYRSEDLGIRKYFVSRGVDRDALHHAHEVLGRSGGPVRMRDLAAELGVSARTATGLVNLLVEGGVARMTRRGAVGDASVSPAEAATLAEAASERRERIERSRLDVMRGYAETRDCRRRVILHYFGDDLTEPCGHCDTCRAGTARTSSTDDDSIPYTPGAAVEHIEWGHGTVSSVEDDRLTVFFEEQGYKTLALDAVIENGLLTLTD